VSGPLDGIRVVEVAQYVAGPLCGLLLADLGAEVVKVEPPGGDGYRYVMPVGPQLGRFFAPLNRGKRSVVLDLKTDAGRDRLQALLATADVAVHNAPAARAEAFGLGWEGVHAAHPRLVLGVVTAFGEAGPLAGAPAYDLVAQARAGLLTAHASTGDEVPVRAGGIPMADLAAGLLLSSAVLAALVRAQRTGAGERVTVSLLAAAMAVQVQDLVWLPGEGRSGARVATAADLDERAGEIRLGLSVNPYYRCFAAADGYLAVACLNRAQREALLDLFGLEDATVDAPDLVPDDAEVLERKRRVTAAVAERIAAEPVATWVDRLGAAGVPCGPVLARETVAGDAQVTAAGLVGSIDQPGLGQLTMLSGLLGGGRVLPVPTVGQHTDEVLGAL
jgi:crotonobetainyl-CoA:carnitine CoA-transferase CaiB-like acyl-CoA transferase